MFGHVSDSAESVSAGAKVLSSCFFVLPGCLDTLRPARYPRQPMVGWDMY